MHSFSNSVSNSISSSVPTAEDNSHGGTNVAGLAMAVFLGIVFCVYCLNSSLKRNNEVNKKTTGANALLLASEEGLSATAVVAGKNLEDLEDDNELQAVVREDYDPSGLQSAIGSFGK